MTGPHTLAVERITVGYDDRVVVEDMTLEVTPGAVTAIVGANGCG